MIRGTLGAASGVRRVTGPSFRCSKWVAGLVGGFECAETVPDVGWKSAREKNLYGSGTGEREGEREMEKWRKELFSPVVTQSASFERRLRIIVQLFLH